MSARAAVTIVFFVNGALYGSWAARVPALQDVIDVGDGGLGLVLGCIAIGALVAMPIGGWASARIGSRKVVKLALAAFVVATPLPSLTGAAVPAGAAALLMGAAGGTLDVSMNAHGVMVERRLGRAVLSSFHAAFSLGGLLGAATGALAAAQDLDVRTHMVVAAGIGLIAGAVAVRGLLPAGADVHQSGPVLVRPPRRLWALGLVGFCCLLAEGATADWSAVYVDGPLGASAGVAALGFTGFSVAMTVVRLAGDRLTERFGEVSIVRSGGLLAAGGLAAALLIAHPIAAIAGFTLLGCGVATVVPVVFRAAGTAPGIAPGVGLAAVSTMGYFGFLVGPPAIGGLAELMGLPGALGLVAGLCGLIALFSPATAPVHVARPEPACA